MNNERRTLQHIPDGERIQQKFAELIVKDVLNEDAIGNDMANI
jgi:hypothetical protein